VKVTGWEGPEAARTEIREGIRNYRESKRKP